MSNLEPPHTPGEHDPLAELDLFEMDPKVRGMLGAMREAQEQLRAGADTIDHDAEEHASRVGCGKLNGDLMTLDLFNDSVSLYGKVRLAPWLDDDDRSQLLADPFFNDSGLHKGKDQRGEYWQLADHQLRMAPIDTDRSTDDTLRPISYVMTLRTEYQARTMEEEQSDPEIAGGLIMYPDDIDHMCPSVLTDRYVEQILMTNYPDVYAQILELLPGESWYDDNDTRAVADAAALERLTRLEIPVSLSLPADFRKSLGIFLFRRLDLDREAGHEFKDYTSLEGLDDDGEWVGYKGKKRKIEGNVVAVEIDQKTHELSYLVTELARGKNNGIELRKIAATSELRVRSTRPRNKRFGKATMWRFDSDEDALRWHHSLDKRAVMPDIERFSHIVDDVDTAKFAVKDWPDRYEVSLDDDLAGLRQEFRNHYETFHRRVGDAGMTPENTPYFPSLDRRVDGLNDVTRGSQCVFTRQLSISFPDDSNYDRAASTIYFNKDDDMALRGTVVDFCGAWVGSANGDRPNEYVLVAIVEDPMLVPYNDSDRIASLEAETVMVRVDDPKATKAYRIIYKKDMEGQNG